MEARHIKPNEIITAPIFDLNTGQCLPDGSGVRRDWIMVKNIKFPKADGVVSVGDRIDAGDGIRRELTYFGGRGCLIPAEVFRKIGLYDKKRLPQYQEMTTLLFSRHIMGFPYLCI